MARCPVPAGLQCEREDTGDARAEGIMGRQVGTWSDRQECENDGEEVSVAH